MTLCSVTETHTIGEIAEASTGAAAPATAPFLRTNCRGTHCHIDRCTTETHTIGDTAQATIGAAAKEKFYGLIGRKRFLGWQPRIKHTIVTYIFVLDKTHCCHI